MSMIKEKLGVSSPDGWSLLYVRELANLREGAYRYKEAGQQGLIVKYELGITHDQRTAIHFWNTSWQWESPFDQEEIETAHRRLIIDRIKEGLEFLDCYVNVECLEISAGLREPEPIPPNPWGPDHDWQIEYVSEGELRIFNMGRSLILPVRELSEDRVEVRMQDLEYWDPPYENDEIGFARKQVLTINLMFILGDKGKTLWLRNNSREETPTETMSKSGG